MFLKLHVSVTQLCYAAVCLPPALTILNIGINSAFQSTDNPFLLNSVPLHWRVAGLFFLPVKDFASRSCSDEPDGWAAKEMDFTFHILGTSKKASRKLFVQHWPEVIAQCHDCPTTISVSNPIPQYWKIRGKNMSYSEVRFAPINATNTASQSIAVPSSPWAEEIEFQIPISILTADYQFSVSLVNECFATSLGTLTLVPYHNCMASD